MQRKSSMECLIKDGKDTVTVDGLQKYCYEHYQIYDSLQKLFKEVSNTQGSNSWRDYLAKVLDTNNKEPWKASLVDSSTGRTLDIVASVARAELNEIET
jgi:hypothetical protein